jgi:transcriptional regulator with XRE-family HTH domain
MSTIFCKSACIFVKVCYDTIEVINMTTGELIKQARKEAGLTQKQLGERMGVSYQSVAQWENDLRNPKQKTIRRIANALGISWTALLPEEERKKAWLSRLESIAHPYTSVNKKLSDIEAQELGILNLTFKTESDRIAYYYSQLNTDGKIVASRLFFQHLDPDSLTEVSVLVEALAHKPQYQQTGESTELTGDTSEPQADHEEPSEDE